MPNAKPTKVRSIAFLLVLLSAIYNSAGADDFTLLGHGVCRPAVNTDKKIYSYKDYSWKKCREICTSKKCSGIEYNIRNDRSICEHHYAPVKLKPTDPNDRVHSCWARTVERGLVSNVPNDAPVKGILETECTWTNDNVASCLVWDCDADGVCVEYGSYCVNKYGQDVPCP